jgi:hopene-associated glycosyltransferase HpnB
VIAAALLSLLAWAYLLAAHGRFWQSGPELAASRPAATPAVAVVVPARDEAPSIEGALRSLLAQDYAGPFRVILVDDGSTDGTGAIARSIADARLTVLTGQARPAGWSGKLWALSQGVAQGVAGADAAEFILLTDADILHNPGHVSALVAKAEAEGFHLASEMVALACDTPAERALVPAFVYFFQLLYPFALVNARASRVAAAAGGTVLVRTDALAGIGGLAAMRGALIDDVALAAKVKAAGPIWLGHGVLARSVRPYPGFGDIWRMIARTAFVQLRHSYALLAGTVLGLALVFLVPPVAAIAGEGLARWAGLAAWAGMAASFVPTLRRYRRSWLWGIMLPLIAAFYMAATIGSAFDHLRGRGVVWKGRAYGEEAGA